MKLNLYLVLFTIGLFQNDLSAQNIEGTYQGWWARTLWTYEFNSNNQFKHFTSGHFGVDTLLGTYALSGDTIILSSLKSDSEIQNNFVLLIDGDSCIIDLTLRYDYYKNGNTYNSKKRDVYYPTTFSNSSFFQKVLDDHISAESCIELKEILIKKKWQFSSINKTNSFNQFKIGDTLELINAPRSRFTFKLKKDYSCVSFGRLEAYSMLKWKNKGNWNIRQLQSGQVLLLINNQIFELLDTHQLQFKYLSDTDNN